MADLQNQRRLLDNLLDSLDDLYDHRHASREQQPEVWLVRLLLASSVALEGSKWEEELLEVANSFTSILRSGVSPADRSDAALAASDNLRLALAAE